MPTTQTPEKISIGVISFKPETSSQGYSAEFTRVIDLAEDEPAPPTISTEYTFTAESVPENGAGLLQNLINSLADDLTLDSFYFSVEHVQTAGHVDHGKTTLTAAIIDLDDEQFLIELVNEERNDTNSGIGLPPSQADLSDSGLLTASSFDYDF